MSTIWTQLAEEGLWDPDAPDADDRRSVIETLISSGATLDEILADPELGRLVARGVLWPGGRSATAADIASESGLDLARIRRIWQTAGFPDPGDRSVFSDSDAVVFELNAIGSDMVHSEEAIDRFMRALGAAARKIAEAAVAFFYREVVAHPPDPDVAQIRRVRRALIATESFQLVAESLVPRLVLHHFGSALELAQASRPVGVAADRAVLTVAFCDLAHSTELASAEDPTVVNRAIEELEARASDLAVSEGGFLVKFLGDEVMFVNPDAAAAVVTALNLRDWVEAHPVLTRLRCGMAKGEVIPRDGDFFGPVVNTAARIAAAAVPGAVMLDQVLTAALSDAIELSVAEPRAVVLRGFDQPCTIAAVDWRR